MTTLADLQNLINARRSVVGGDSILPNDQDSDKAIFQAIHDLLASGGGGGGGGYGPLVDRDGDRLLDTPYTNSTGKAILILVRVLCQAYTTNDYAFAKAYVTTSENKLLVAESGQGEYVNNGNYTYTLVFPVQAGSSYEVDTQTSSQGSVFLEGWVEST